MQDRVLDIFLDLARIDSESLHEAAVAAYVMETARSLGFETYMDGAAKMVGGDAGNVYIKIPSCGIDAPPLIFCAHMDTVTPGKGVEPLVEDGRVISRGDTILGADCKAGVAAIIELMNLSSEGKLEHGPLEMILTVVEEKGLKGVQEIEWKRIDARHAVVLDGAGEVGEVVNASPTQDNLEMVFTGRAAHAGVEPEKGVNAIMGASWAISRMNLGRIDGETTANIGTIEGGRAVNIVPDRVEVKGEVRSHDLAKLEKQRESMVAVALEAEDAVGVGVKVEVERAYDGYRVDPEDALVMLAVEAGRNIGLKTKVGPSGGGSDANFLNSSGVKSVVLSMGAREPHTFKENIDVKDLHKLVKISKEMARAAGILKGS
jgi:tripeptide aminopeptidase